MNTTTKELAKIIAEDIEPPDQPDQNETESTEPEEIELEDEAEDQIGDFVVNAAGVYYQHEVKGEIENIHVCSTLTIEAESRNKEASADSGARRTGFLGERENDSGVKANRIPG